MSPQQVAFMVKMYRAARIWDQKTLASEARLAIENIVRIEAGEPSTEDVKVKLARAMTIVDENVFMKPWPFPANESYMTSSDPTRIFETAPLLKKLLKL